MLSFGKKSSVRALSFESLESRKLLAVVWGNRGSATNNSDNFNSDFAGNSTIARTIVDKAISDWNTVLKSTTDLTVQISAGNIPALGTTSNWVASTATLTLGRPLSATITLDNDGSGFNWYFDSNINSDSEFDQLETGFSGFTTQVPANSRPEFYTTILHELGHALGYARGTNNNLAINRFLVAGPVAGQLTYNNPNGRYTQNQVLGTTGAGLHSLTTSDLMFSTVSVGNRKLISDETVKLLVSTYGYSVENDNGLPLFPEYVNNLFVDVDPSLQVVTVRGLRNVANDRVSLSVSTNNSMPFKANSYSIGVNAFLEFVPNSYRVINVSTGAGDDRIDVSLDNSADLLGTTNIDAGVGTDTVFYQGYASALSDFELKLTGNTIDRINRFGIPGPLRRVVSSNIETLNLFTGAGADLVTLSPTLAANPSLSPIRVTTYSGNDIINASGSAVGVVVYAGWDNDNVTGSPFADILFGDTGIDTINGSGGRDIVFGGSGLDSLTTNTDSDEDIVVSGTTSYDNAPWDRIQSIRSEWVSTRTRNQRIANISGTGTGGNNGTFYLIDPTTVFNDGMTDSVFAQTGVDWFIS